MSAICDRCGEELAFELEFCPDCEENLCEYCWGDKNFEVAVCKDCLKA